MGTGDCVHIVKASVFAREAEWRIVGERLLWGVTGANEGPNSGMIALDQIASVRLTREQIGGRARMFCRIRTRDGATAVIGSAHHVGLLRGEDRSGSYRALVRTLIGQVAARNPNAEFLTGAKPIVWWTVVLGLSSLFGALGGLVVLAGREIFTTRLILGLALVALGAPNLLRWLMSNRPGTFDPENPPL